MRATLQLSASILVHVVRSDHPPLARCYSFAQIKVNDSLYDLHWRSLDQVRIRQQRTRGPARSQGPRGPSRQGDFYTLRADGQSRYVSRNALHRWIEISGYRSSSGIGLLLCMVGVVPVPRTRRPALAKAGLERQRATEAERNIWDRPTWSSRLLRLETA